RRHSLSRKLLGCGLNLLLIRLCNAERLFCCFYLDVRITGVEQVVRKIGYRFPPGDLLEFSKLIRAEVALQASKSAGQCRQRVEIESTLRHIVEQLLQCC